MKSESRPSQQSLWGITKFSLSTLVFTFGFQTPHQALAATTYQWEDIPQNESAAIETVKTLIVDQLSKEHAAKPNDVVRRDAHAKAHGCVSGNLQVLDESHLPTDLREGLFAIPGANYSAIIRFSNGSGRIQSDSIPDGRGLALKVLGVNGKKILSGAEKATTQDFVMINHPQFFVKDAQDYVDFQNSITKSGHPLEFFKSHGAEALIAGKIALGSIGNPAKSQYWTMTPYLLGEHQAAKYSVRPCKSNWFDEIKNILDPNSLFSSLKKSLQKPEGLCMELMAQVAPTRNIGTEENPKLATAEGFPVEDPRIEWNEALAPFRTVARIQIPQQSFDSPEQWWTCENLSFTPWHSLPQHRPLGGINRVRKAVYEAVSSYRHAANGQTHKEP